MKYYRKGTMFFIHYFIRDENNNRIGNASATFPLNEKTPKLEILGIAKEYFKNIESKEYNKKVEIEITAFNRL